MRALRRWGPAEAAARSERITRGLLRCGLVSGPVFVGVTAMQAIARRGFDLRRHGISLLSLGDRGWVQVANFVVAGALSIGFAQGVRRALSGRPGAAAATVLVTGYGLGLVGTGLFLVDPGLGFPPGGPPGPAAVSWHGALHAAAPPLAFGSLIGLAAVFARRYRDEGRPRRATASLAAGAGTAVLIFVPGDGGSVRSAAAVLIASAWLTSVAADLLRTPPDPRPC